jgi:hypothetical protein
LARCACSFGMAWSDAQVGWLNSPMRMQFLHGMV